MAIQCRYNVKGTGELTSITFPRPVTKDIGHFINQDGPACSSPSKFAVSLRGAEDNTQK